MLDTTNQISSSSKYNINERTFDNNRKSSAGIEVFNGRASIYGHGMSY